MAREGLEQSAGGRIPEFGCVVFAAATPIMRKKKMNRPSTEDFFEERKAGLFPDPGTHFFLGYRPPDTGSILAGRNQRLAIRGEEDLPDFASMAA